MLLRCRQAMAKVTRHRVLCLCWSAVQSFKSNVARKRWKRQELAAAQQMHDSMLMSMCTKHVVTLGVSKMQLDIVKRTKALADGLQLAAPYAMHWLLKTRHRLQNRSNRYHTQDPGQENFSANCAVIRAPQKSALAQWQLKQANVGNVGQAFQSTTLGGVDFPAASRQQRKQVC